MATKPPTRQRSKIVFPSKLVPVSLSFPPKMYHRHHPLPVEGVVSKPFIHQSTTGKRTSMVSQSKMESTSMKKNIFPLESSGFSRGFPSHAGFPIEKRLSCCTDGISLRCLEDDLGPKDVAMTDVAMTSQKKNMGRFHKNGGFTINNW